MSLFDIHGNQIIANHTADTEKFLKGVKWVPIGDSITTMSTYRAVLSDYHGMTTICGGFQGGLQAGYASGENNCVLSIVDNIAAGTPDIVTIALGTNDHGNGCPIGSIDDDEDSQTPENFSFIGCYKKLVKTIYEKYDDVPIVLLTPFPKAGKDSKNASGHTLTDYADAIKEIGAYYSLHVVDLYRNSGVPFGTLASLAEYGGDGLHITKKYGQIAAPVVAETMRLALERYEVACTSMIKSAWEPTLTDTNAKSVYVVPFPGGMTEAIVWTSSDDNVVSVVGNENYATVTAVANGQATVQAKCGSVVATFDFAVSL